MTEGSGLGGLEAALRRWEAAGLISAEQARAIRAAEASAGARAERPARRRQATTLWAVTVSGLGALVLGLGVLALVGSNWRGLPGWAKLLCVLLPMLGAYAAGYRLRDDPRPGRPRLPGLGAALYLLGGTLFGGLIALLAQGFQLPLETATLLLVWGVGLLILAYAVRLPAALHLALPLGVVIPLGGVTGYTPLMWLSSAEAACAAVSGVGLALLGVALAHDARRPPDALSGDALSHPWAFWGPPLGLGGVYALHLTADQTFSAWLLLTLALALGTVWLGHEKGRRAWVNWGLVAVGVVVLTVYFTLLGTLATTGYALVGAGALLLGLGWALERARRRLSPGTGGAA